MKTIVFVLNVAILLFSQSIFAETNASFSVNRTLAGVNVELHFISTSSTDSGPLKYTWDFGDGTIEIDSTEEVYHAYVKAGSYVAKLTVEDQLGVVAEDVLTVEIIENSFPTAEFYVQGKEAIINKSTAFMATIEDVDSKISDIEWFVEGQKVATNISVFYYTFNSLGEHEVSLEVTDGFGAKAVVSKLIDVLEPNIKPEVRIVFDRDALFINQDIVFNAQTNDADGSVIQYFWKLGHHGRYLEGTDTKSLKFFTPDTERLWLKVVDDRGGETEASVRFRVEDPNILPEIEIESSEDTLVVGKKSKFKLKVEGKKKQIKSVKWTISDGTKVNKKYKITHTFNNAGTFTIDAEVKFKNGSLKNISKDFEVVEEQVQTNSTVTQIYLDSPGYIELNPYEEYEIEVKVWDEVGAEITSFSTITWTSQNSKVTFENKTSDRADVKGGASSGTDYIYATVDGVDSQIVEVKVNGFSNDLAVSKKGRIIGESYVLLNVTRDESPGSYTFEIDGDKLFNEYLPTADDGGGIVPERINFNTYISLMPDQTTASFTVRNTDTPLLEESITATGLNSFQGRNGFLYFGKNTSTASRISNFDDDRFMEFDEDFSVSYWHYYRNVGYTALYLVGSYTINFRYDDVVISGNGFTKNLKIPGNGWGWRFHTLTYDSATREIKVYQNSDLITSYTVPENPTSTEDDIYLQPINAQYHALDELRFWNKTLSQAEISSEMLTPLSLSSTDLMAAFSFDQKGYQEMKSDNSNWILTLGASPFHESTDPWIMDAPTQLASNSLDTTVENKLSFETTISNLGKRRGNFRSDENTFSNDPVTVSVYHSDCELLCALEENDYYVRDNRISPYYKVFYGEGSDTNGSFVVRLPFDSSDSKITDIKGLKVIFAPDVDSSWDQEKWILAPDRINMEEGYVEVSWYKKGYFWVSQMSAPDTFSIVYDNEGISPYITGALGGRIFREDESEISGGEYDLESSDAGSHSKVGVACDGNVLGDLTFPITFEGLSDGSICYVEYTYRIIPFESYYHRDFFIFN